ncbi:YceI family protein [Azospirillum sp.]|uniref:YceI family protein n=1 Tax=Azospirillum sp. TaxID=34012 RepID=UPI003D7291EB
MKTFASALLLAGLFAGAATPALALDSYKLDPAHVSVVFKVNHLGYSNLWGRFNAVSGAFALDPADPANSKVEVVIKTESVDTNHQKRDDHLRSPDYLNSVEFPEMKFVSTKVEKTGDKAAKVHGNLTMLGVTKAVVLDAVLNNAGAHPFRKEVQMAGLSATTKIKRSDFGLTYSVPAIGDDLELFLEIEGVKQ